MRKQTKLPHKFILGAKFHFTQTELSCSNKREWRDGEIDEEARRKGKEEGGKGGGGRKEKRLIGMEVVERETKKNVRKRK